MNLRTASRTTGQQRLLMALGLIGAAVLLLDSGCVRADGNRVRKQTRFVMDTYCTIQAHGPEATVDSAITAALDRVEEIDERFNFLDSLSPLYRFNETGEPIEDNGIVRLMDVALDVTHRSNGAFDVTIQPLLELWGFYGDSPAVPDSGAVASRMEFVGSGKLRLADGQLSALRPGVNVDLGGIAKGYALAEAARVLRQFGIDSALIDAGGDVYAIGKHNGKNWGIGVRDPRGGEGMIAVVEASDLAVVTSGDYERFFTVDDSRYSHILDPRTGYPARGLISVTVVARDPTIADAWATALFVLGPEGIQLAEESEDIEALLVTEDLRVLATSQLMALAREAEAGSERNQAGGRNPDEVSD